MKYFFSFVFALFIFQSYASADLQKDVGRSYNKIEKKVHKIYKDFHQHPELSGLEYRTSEKMALYLRELGYKVSEKVGGTGVVAVLKNGDGPTIWLRADMDGLPILEETKFKFKSKNKGVMHGCGHDTHISAMVGYAEVLKDLKANWKGTLVLIVQPAEETVAGAKAMIDDGLFKKFPKPDYILAFHVGGHIRAGEIEFATEYALAASDRLEITVKGVGGHGASPHHTVDPIVLASKMIISLQTIVSRNIDPQDPVVLSFGKITGGTKSNIIPNEVQLEGTLRTYNNETRIHVIKRIKKIIAATAEGEAAPKPILKMTQSVPSTFNNPKLAETLLPTLHKIVGTKNVRQTKGIMGAEDFSYYSREQKYPAFFYFVGGAPKNRKNYGPNHSSKFAPEYKKVLKVGVESMALTTLHLINKKIPTVR